MTTTVADLRVNARTTPRGVGTDRPSFAWKLFATHNNVLQHAYQVQVATNAVFTQLLWDSDRVDDDAQFAVRYRGVPLAGRTTYAWRVRVWTGDAQPSAWSASSFETGVLDPADWSAHWISTPLPAPKPSRETVYFRTAETIAAPVLRGRAYATALGWYRLFVNGHDLTGHALVPRWTQFDEQVEYQVYDVTAAFKRGLNVIAIAVGDGRFRGANGATTKPAIYGDRLAALVQIELDLADGTTARIVTDGSWVVGDGRIRTSDPKLGEVVDLRVSDSDWLLAPDAPSRFAPAGLLPPHPRTLIAEDVEPVRAISTLRGTVSSTPSGKQVIDFGQNFAGVASIRLSGPAGALIRISYSELLRNGELDTFYLAGGGKGDKWMQKDLVRLGGDETTYTPWFTIRGFRYVEVDGLDRTLTADDVTGVVLSSDLRSAGSFHSTDERLNQLHSNVLWSLRSNYTDTATDCPTRERSGWTADINMFASTGATMVDSDAYLRRYLANLASEQRVDGRVPPFVPSETSKFSKATFFDKMVWATSTSVGWGDTAVMLPWTHYQQYGDPSILSAQYDSAKRWVDQLAHRAASRHSRIRRPTHRVGKHERYIVDTGYHWGEWLRPGENGPRQILVNIIRTRAEVATAYLAHSAYLLSRIAAVLDHSADADKYHALATRAGEAWRAAFIRADGTIGADRQDDYVRALAFDLLLPHQRESAFTRLVHLIEQAEFHLGTGFLSTPMLLQTLVDNGRTDLAYRVLLQTSSPSWLSQIDQGATTIWETWTGKNRRGLPDGSFNHYAFGSVIGWLKAGLVGITMLEPGYRRARISPAIHSGIDGASASIDTPFGPIAASWRRDGDTITLSAQIAPGTTAEIVLGNGTSVGVGSGEHRFGWTAADSGALQASANG